PHTLTASACGHSFCGICLLRWCFSKYTSQDGLWIQLVSCPVCRAEPQDGIEWSCPVIPNRSLDYLVQKSLENLQEIAAAHNEATGRQPIFMEEWRNGGKNKVEWLKKRR
ncbi:hypothetical protein BV25DRAFT_1815640, partial [Artomyces pyxidatus]